MMVADHRINDQIIPLSHGRKEHLRGGHDDTHELEGW